MTAFGLLSKTGSGTGSGCFLNARKAGPQITQISRARAFEVGAVNVLTIHKSCSVGIGFSLMEKNGPTDYTDYTDFKGKSE